MTKRKIAIIGAGFSGLAVAWHLSKNDHVTLFDGIGIGGGASRLASGILHPFGGAHAKLNRLGREGVEATLKLVRVAEQALSRSLVVPTPLLRVALSEEQEEDFSLAAEKYDDVTWLTAPECYAKVPGVALCPGILIQAHNIHIPGYLEGLWKASEENGAVFKKQAIQSLQELDDYDVIVIATGAGAHFREMAGVPLKTVKGQLLELSWPKGIPPLPFPLNSQAYLTMSEGGASCIAGTTFERTYESAEPDLERAKADILPKVYALFPPLKEAQVLNCFAGIRSTAPEHFPITSPLNNRTWLIAGMGSKGLLYHAMLACKIV